MANQRRKDNDWKEAKKRCRLNMEEVQMAKELGMKPRSLIKNIPSPNQQWKLPVKQWVRELYFKKFRRHTLREEAVKKASSHKDDGVHSNLIAGRTAPARLHPNDHHQPATQGRFREGALLQYSNAPTPQPLGFEYGHEQEHEHEAPGEDVDIPF